MRVCVVALVVIACAVAAARADTDIGVVTSGAKATEVAAHLDKYLGKQGHKTVAGPLSKDATSTLVNCFTLDDLKCARGVVEARAKSLSLVYVGIDAAGKNLTFTVYWFVKGHEPIGERRTCEGCTDTAWRTLVESMLQRLADSARVDMGRLALDSNPSGMVVLLDDVQIGATPLERDVPSGKHSITLTHRGRTVGKREVDITGGQTSQVTMKVDIDEAGGRGGSRLWPGLLLGAGALTAAAGGVMLYVGSQDDASRKWIYPGLVPGGIALCAVGGGAILGGAILLVQAGSSRSGPVATANRSGAYLGWVSRF